MTAMELLSRLWDLGVAATASGSRLHLEAPRGVMTPELLAEVQSRKAELVSLLRPEVPPWSGQRVTIEDLPAFKEKWGLRVVSITWPEDVPCPVATCLPEAGHE